MTMIDRSRPNVSLSAQRRFAPPSRASLYYRPRGESAETLAPMRRIDELFVACPFHGSRRIVRPLERGSVRVGRHRVRRRMGLMGLQAIHRAPRTSDPHPEHKIYPHLLRDGL